MEEKEGRSDRLSDLPDHILFSILSLLGIKAAFRTSILSNRWRALWKSVPDLCFHRESGETGESFRERVGKVLSLRNDDCNLRRLTFSFGDDVSEQSNDDELFELVMKYAASHGLQRLSISPSRGRPYCEESIHTQIVGSVSNCDQSLGTLELMSFHLSETAASSFWLGFQVLTTLTLDCCSFHVSDSETSIDPFAKLPCLKNLKLVCCLPCCAIDPVRLKISGPQLLKLELVEIMFFRLVEVTAPKLESFGCWGDVMLLDVPKLNIPCLDHAYIRVARFDPRYEETVLQSLGKVYMEWFRALCNARSLTIHFDAIKILGATRNLLEEKSSELSPFTRLMSLNVLYSEEVVPEIPDRLMRYFMEGSPGVNVDEKIVEFRKVAPPSFPYN